MSVAQDEITAQINAIKGEWSQTVSSLDSNEDAPSGLTRPEFKEVARVRNVSCHARPPAPACAGTLRGLAHGQVPSAQWKQLKQQKAKFYLLQLEERLKRLHLLESRSPACLLSRAPACVNMLRFPTALTQSRAARCVPNRGTAGSRWQERRKCCPTA